MGDEYEQNIPYDHFHELIVTLLCKLGLQLIRGVKPLIEDISHYCPSFREQNLKTERERGNIHIKYLRGLWEPTVNKDNDIDNRSSMVFHPGIVHCTTQTNDSPIKQCPDSSVIYPAPAYT